MKPSIVQREEPQLQSTLYVIAFLELREAMRANKPQEEIQRILLSSPRLMASFIINRSKYLARRKQKKMKNTEQILVTKGPETKLEV